MRLATSTSALVFHPVTRNAELGKAVQVLVPLGTLWSTCIFACPDFPIRLQIPADSSSRIRIFTMKNDEKCGFRSNVTGTLEIFGICPRMKTKEVKWLSNINYAITGQVSAISATVQQRRHNNEKLISCFGSGIHITVLTFGPIIQYVCVYSMNLTVAIQELVTIYHEENCPL